MTKKKTAAQKQKAREYARDYHRRKMAEKLEMKKREELTEFTKAPDLTHDLVDSWYEAVRTLKLSTKDIEIKKELNKILAYIISENS